MLITVSSGRRQGRPPSRTVCHPPLLVGGSTTQGHLRLQLGRWTETDRSNERHTGTPPNASNSRKPVESNEVHDSHAFVSHDSGLTSSQLVPMLLLCKSPLVGHSDQPFIQSFGLVGIRYASSRKSKVAFSTRVSTPVSASG